MTSILFLTGPRSAAVLILMIPAVRALLALWRVLMLVVLLISGGICTRTLLVSLGPGGMTLLPRVLVFVVSLMSSVSSFAVVPCPFSDHCALLLSVSVPDVVPPWSWVVETEYLYPVRGCLLRSNLRCLAHLARLHPSFPLSRQIVGEGESLTKGLTIKYCCERSRARSSSRDLLVRLVDHLKAKVDGGFASCVGPYHSAPADLAI